MNEVGVLRSEPCQIYNIIVDYFANLFSSSGTLVLEDVLESIQRRVAEAINEAVRTLYTKGKWKELFNRYIPTRSLHQMG